MPGLMLKRSHEQMEAGSKGTGPGLQNPETADCETPRKRQMVDGPNGVSVKEDSSSGQAAAKINGADTQQASSQKVANIMAPIQSVANELPPEIERVPEENYWPLSLLVDRLAQNTFEGLHDVIDELAETSQIQVNGAGPAGTQELNTERKARLWHFAQDSRAKFVKLLVLSQWSRSAESIMRVIDINQYLTKQKDNYNNANGWVGALKTILASQNVPAPDLKSTMTVLAEGKASWISDLNYIPKPRLTPAEMLQALRQINTLLTIRLGLHRPPESLQDFRVHDGRVTFSVQDEFELDLSIGSEDHSEQLYFLDFRFTFSPGGGRLRDSRVRSQIESQINYILRTQGLSECYDFLHNLTLTHKLSILRSQTSALLASRWGDNIRFELVHRALILEYWTNIPGGRHRKNWLEIGIRRQPAGEATPSGAPPEPYLSIRWHRHGKEVFDHCLEVDPAELSLETILRDTLAAHTNYIFSSVRKDLQRKIGSSGSIFKVKQHRSPVEPADCSLEIVFPDETRVTMTQEPVSGRLAFLPASTLHRRFDAKLRGLPDPASEASGVVKQLRAATASERSQRKLAMAGWSHVSVPRLGPQTLQSSFYKPDVYRVEYCRPPYWSGEWCLALSHHTSGYELWHLLRLKENFSEPLSREDVLLGREKSPFKTVIMICYDPSGSAEANGKMLPVWNIQSSSPLQEAKSASTGGEGSENASSALEDLQSNKYDFLFSLAAHGAAIASQYSNGNQLGSPGNKHDSSKVFKFEPTSPNVSVEPIVPRDDDGPDAFYKVCVANLRLGLWERKLRECYKRDVRTYIAGVYPGDGTVVTVTHAELLQPLPMSTEILRFPAGAFQVDKRNPRRITVQLNIKMGQTVIQDLTKCLFSFSNMTIAAKCLQQQSLDIGKVELNRIDVSLQSLDATVVRRERPLSPEQLRVTFYRKGSNPRDMLDSMEFGRGSPHARNQVYWSTFLKHWGLSITAKRLELCHALVATAIDISRQPVATRPWVSFRDVDTMRLLWGTDDISIKIDCRLSKTPSNDVVWCFKFRKHVKEGMDAPAAINKTEEAWKNGLAHTKAEGLEGLGEEVIAEWDRASPAIWHVIDTLKPSIEELYESLKKPSDETKPEEASQKEAKKEKETIQID